MQEEHKQSGLSWSIPKDAPSDAPKPAQAPQAAEPAASKLGFPSSRRMVPTQAPVYAGLLVCGIIVGVLLASSWAPRPAPVPAAPDTQAAVASPASSSSSSSTPATTKAAPTDSPLTVSDQPAGPSVSIARLNIARPTWVAVYVSREGKPGNALGARLFFPGDKTGKVGLLRDTEEGQLYFVGLSVDDGDRAFSLSKDKPVADADGGPLWATFRAL